LNETPLTKLADSSGYPAGATWVGVAGFRAEGALEPEGGYPYQLRSEHPEPATPLS